MGVAMEASSTSHFLTEFICEFPMLVPVPSCKYRRGGVPFSCCLVTTWRADVARLQPSSLLPPEPELVVEPAMSQFLSHPSMLSFVSSWDGASKPQPVLGNARVQLVSDGDMSSWEFPLPPSSWRNQWQPFHSDPPPRLICHPSGGNWASCSWPQRRKDSLT